jgi:hypothetical protein
MSAAEIVAKVRVSGRSISLDGADLVIRPRLTPDLLAEVRSHKAEIIALLEAEAVEPRCPRHTGNEIDNTGCGWCALLRAEEKAGVRFVIGPTRQVSEQYRWADGSWNLLPEPVKRPNGSWGWSDGRALLTDPPPPSRVERKDRLS